MSTPRIVVVLVRAEGPLNVGSVARLCGNFGARLRLVDVRADVTSSDAIKMAHPSEDLLQGAEHFTSLHDALHDVELAVGTSSKIASAVQGPVLDVDTARTLLTSGVLALVFGNERTGLALDEAAQCARVMRLPARVSTIVIGNPIVPVIKICANPRTVRLMSEHVDVDSSGLLQRDITLDQAGDKLLECMLRTANGRLTAAEALGHREFVMTRLYESA